MKSIVSPAVRYCLVAISLGIGFAISTVTPTTHAASAQVREAQTVLTKYGIPVGPIDGAYGPQTARGLCAFRALAGLKAHRGNVDSTTMQTLRTYNSRYRTLAHIPAPANEGYATYLTVNKTCQTMTYVEQKRYKRIMPVSTGMRSHATPSGNYLLGYTERGWSCSTEYPESCRKQTTGRFANVSNYGNMYNQRFFKSGGYFVHGSTSVPTYPASHGCIRVTVNDSDWMYDHVGNYGKVFMKVMGTY